MKWHFGSLSNVNKTLFIVLILLITIFIKVYPFYQYTFEPSGYSGGERERINNFLETGYDPPSVRGEVILDKLGYATILITPGISPEMNLLLNSFFLSLVFSLVILLFARCYIKNKIRFGFATTVLVILFSISATPDVIVRLAGSNGPYAWIFLFLFIYFILFRKYNKINTGLGLFFLFILPLTYFTIALYLAVILAIALGYQLIFRKSVFPRNLSILYEVFFISWVIYMSLAGFDTILSSFSMFQSFVSSGSRVLVLNYIAGGSTISVIKNSLCNILACIPLFYFVVWGYKRVNNKIRHFFTILIISLFFISGGLFIWMGLTGVIQRIPNLFVLFSILLFANVLNLKPIKKNNLRDFKYIILVVAVGGAIVLSSFSYLTSEYTSSKISFGEAGGTYWLRTNIDSQEIIFTDFRLSGPLVARGYSTIIIDDVSLPPERVNQLLEDIYYNEDDPMDALLSIGTSEGRSFDFLFFSQRCTQRFPGLKGYDYNFLPPPKNFLEKYKDSNKLNHIYENNEVTIFFNQRDNN